MSKIFCLAGIEAGNIRIVAREVANFLPDVVLIEADSDEEAGQRLLAATQNNGHHTFVVVGGTFGVDPRLRLPGLKRIMLVPVVKEDQRITQSAGLFDFIVRQPDRSQSVLSIVSGSI